MLYLVLGIPVLQGISVLVNGSPAREFGVEKGLRQGDPLSPFLFNVVVEGLSALLKKTTDLELVKWGFRLLRYTCSNLTVCR